MLFAVSVALARWGRAGTEQARLGAAPSSTGISAGVRTAR
jgi:hypothetical protein